MKSKRIYTLLLTQKQIDFLKQVKEETNVSVSHQIRDLIELKKESYELRTEKLRISYKKELFGEEFKVIHSDSVPYKTDLKVLLQAWLSIKSKEGYYKITTKERKEPIVVFFKCHKCSLPFTVTEESSEITKYGCKKHPKEKIMLPTILLGV